MGPAPRAAQGGKSGLDALPGGVYGQRPAQGRYHREQ